MNILVTAGNTQAPIDRVRCLTNIFSGRTGASIATEASKRGHQVSLFTSHPEAVTVQILGQPLQQFRIVRYQTFAELRDLMAKELESGVCDGLIHSAAVSDYLVGGIFAPDATTQFSCEELVWKGTPPALLDRSAEKVKSDDPELWLRLVRAPKLVDKLRTEWSFGGVLVKFKLEVHMEDKHLLDIAERSRLQSGADFMVANTLEGMHEWAFLGPLQSSYERVPRGELAKRLMDAVERKHKERMHG